MRSNSALKVWMATDVRSTGDSLPNLMLPMLSSSSRDRHALHVYNRRTGLIFVKGFCSSLEVPDISISSTEGADEKQILHRTARHL